MEGYQTHEPILRSIGKLFPEIKRVLEYGSGIYSTGLFLDRDVFPNLEKLDSTENDCGWITKTRERFGNDCRWLLVGDDEVDPTNEYDLVMIDSSSRESRCRTADKLIALEFSGIVVFHDTEAEWYQSSLEKFPYRYKFNQFLPNTDVLSLREIPKLREICV
jgi:hypothetical protein